MKAFMYNIYGPPSVLEQVELDKPTPKDHEVLVKVFATSINASDWELLTGKPLYARIYGLLKPRIKILGSDIAGIVESVGKEVVNFKIGDQVFGDVFGHFGGFAEYVAVTENCLRLKPIEMSFEEAAALPQASTIAQQVLCDIFPGQHILINGAGGGAGSFAIQLAKAHGALVTAVDRTDKLDMMRKLGADHAIDYTKDDFTKNIGEYDLILDLAAHHKIFSYLNALKTHGRYVMVGGSMKNIFKILLLGPFISMKYRKKMRVFALKLNHGLNAILDHIEKGNITVAVDKQYSFADIPRALQYLGEGSVKGKIVISVAHY